MGYRVGSVVYVRPAGVVQVKVPKHVSYCPVFQGE
jgi:hypothetical protein